MQCGANGDLQIRMGYGSEDFFSERAAGRQDGGSTGGSTGRTATPAPDRGADDPHAGASQLQCGPKEKQVRGRPRVSGAMRESVPPCPATTRNALLPPQARIKPLTRTHSDWWSKRQAPHSRQVGPHVWPVGTPARSRPRSRSMAAGAHLVQAAQCSSTPLLITPGYQKPK